MPSLLILSIIEFFTTACVARVKCLVICFLKTGHVRSHSPAEAARIAGIVTTMKQEKHGPWDGTIDPERFDPTVVYGAAGPFDAAASERGTLDIVRLSTKETGRADAGNASVPEASRAESSIPKYTPNLERISYAIPDRTDEASPSFLEKRAGDSDNKPMI